MIQATVVLLTAAMLTSAVASAQQSPDPFKAGDRVIFAGNSITEAGFYGLYIWQYYQLHYPDKRIDIMNGGIGGDVAGQIRDRFDQDLLPFKPSVLVLTFGMNDSRYFEYNATNIEQVRKEAVSTSYKSYLEIERKLKAQPGIRPILMSSSPFDITRGGDNNRFIGKFETMEQIVAFQKKAARENNWRYVDLFYAMNEIDKRGQRKDSMFTLTGSDRIHPGNMGHFVMAYLFLKAQGLAGKPVASVKINAKNGKVQRSENCLVSEVRASATDLRFDYFAKSLPYPSDSSSRLWQQTQKQVEALDQVPFTKEMNTEQLAIEGLKRDQRYELRIDDQVIGTYAGKELEQGINLALLSNTPQYQQAKQVADLNLQYRDLEQKLRSYYWLQFNYFNKKNMQFQDNQAALDSVIKQADKDWAVASKRDNYKEAYQASAREGWKQQMTEIMNRIYTINRPVNRHVRVTAVLTSK